MGALKVDLHSVAGMLVYGSMIATTLVVFGRAGPRPDMEYRIHAECAAAGAIVGALAGAAQVIHAATRKPSATAKSTQS